jgi:hypothetical protein
MSAPFSAFPSQWYRARVLAEAVQEDHCRGPGASTRQALQYTRPGYSAEGWHDISGFSYR